MANDTLKTVTEYAKMMGKSRQRVHQLIKSKDIKPTFVGGKTFIDLALYPNWVGK